MCVKLNKVMGAIWTNKNNTNNNSNTKCNNITPKIYIHRHQNHRVGCIECLKPFLIVLLAIICSVDDSNCFIQRPEHHKQEQSHSYVGGFVGEQEAKEIAFASSTRLAKIPCNISTKINCFYAEKLKFSLPKNNMHDHYQRNHQNHQSSDIVVSWVTISSNMGNINETESLFTMTENNYINSNNNNKNNNNNSGTAKKQSDIYDFNWIFELLACMMLASAFEICLLVLRNLRNISLAFYGFWSAFKVRIQKIFYACRATASTNTSGSQCSNVTGGEERTLSYIFAFLTWRATHTAKGSGPYSESNSKEENANITINYEHVTTMGDLLLLILFTHVYFLRQKAQQDSVHMKVENEPQNREHITNSLQQFYDKKSYMTTSSKGRACLSQTSNKHCQHYCGNLYQQPSSTFANNTTTMPLLQNRFGNNYTSQQKLATPTSSSYLTCCCDIVCTTCYLCQCSCTLYCYCCGCGNRYQRCYHNMPICNTCCCCCLYKLSKTSDDNNYDYSCWSDICSGKDFCCFWTFCSHCVCHCCCHHHYFTSDQLYCKRLIRTYNSYCSFGTNAAYFLTPSCENKTNSIRAFRSLNTAAYLTTNVHEYSLFLKLKNNNSYYSVIYMIDGNPNIIYKHSYYRLFVDLLNSMLPQYLLRVQNVPTILKWKKLQVAVVVVVLIVICASSGTNYDYHHHYYSSSFGKCKGLTARWCQLNMWRRKRCRRKYQHSKVLRSKSHHYLHASLMRSKRQKLKNFHKKYINNPQEICTITTQQQLSSSILSCEFPSLVLCTTTSNNISTATSPQVNDALVHSIKEVCGSKPNIVWLLIGLIWFEGPKIVNCNILHYQTHKQQHEQQHQQQHQHHHHQHQQSGNVHKETTTNSFNSNFEHKTENFSQMKTKNSSNNNSNNNNKKNTNTNNKNKNSNNNNDGNSSNDSNSNNNNNDNNKTNNNDNDNKSSTSSNINLSANIIPIINTMQFKHYCNNISKNYQQQKLKRSSQRVQRALQSLIMDSSITSSASSNYNDVSVDIGLEKIQSSSGSLTYEECVEYWMMKVKNRRQRSATRIAE